MMKSISRSFAFAAVLSPFFATNESTAMEILAPEPSSFAAEVVRDDTTLHAGPGREFYATDKLAKGTRVEIFRRDEGGWLAIRPMESSFSWMKNSQLRITSDPATAEVVRDGAKSWIGSHRSNTKGFHHQVALKVGERVEILGKKTLASASGALETWYKIAPPAGEFRWIHPGQVQLLEERATLVAQTSTDQTSTDQTSTDRTSSDRTSSAQTSSAQTSSDRTSSELKFQSPRSAGSRQDPNSNSRTTTRTGFHEVAATTRPFTTTAPSSAEFHDAKLERLKRIDQTLAEIDTSDLSPFREPNKLPIQLTQQAEKVGSSPRQLEQQIEDFDQKLRRVEVNLSLMVANDVSKWRFNDLRLELAELIKNGETPLQRGRARLLLEKLEEFAKHANRRSDITASGNFDTAAVGEELRPVSDEVEPFQEPTLVRQVSLETNEAIGTGIASANSTGTTVSVLKGSFPANRPIVDETTYDGKGWLMPVYSRAGDAPRYALTDKNAKVLSFVTPAPGYNLHRYLKMRVGIYGQRSYLTEANTPHITAHRVIDLDRHIR
ncbi:MAG: hypothetical protein ACI9HK_003732 [Pirellulaceae bacterium]|jgi:uncharacterized protein YgiM (DUF1202 family)